MKIKVKVWMVETYNLFLFQYGSIWYSLPVLQIRRPHKRISVWSVKKNILGRNKIPVGIHKDNLKRLTEFTEGQIFWKTEVWLDSIDIANALLDIDQKIKNLKQKLLSVES